MLLDIDSLQAVSHFSSRAWFHRLWILQEVYFASKDSRLLCGADSIEWLKVRSAIMILFKKSITGSTDADINHLTWIPSVNILRRNLEILYTLCGSILDDGEVRKWDFIVLVASAKHSQCLDPRDRVFGLLSLIWSERLLLYQTTQKVQLMSIAKQLSGCSPLTLIRIS